MGTRSKSVHPQVSDLETLNLKCGLKRFQTGSSTRYLTEAKDNPFRKKTLSPKSQMTPK
jgi:hypothetical protein